MHRTLTALTLALSIGFLSPSGILEPLWSHLSALWQGTEANAPQPRSRQKAGGGCDPFGRCLPAAPDHADEGCGADPDGRCNPGS